MLTQAPFLSFFGACALAGLLFLIIDVAVGYLEEIKWS